MENNKNFIKKAEELKKEALEAYINKEYLRAIDIYDQSIEILNNALNESSESEKRKIEAIKNYLAALKEVANGDFCLFQKSDKEGSLIGFSKAKELLEKASIFFPWENDVESEQIAADWESMKSFLNGKYLESMAWIQYDQRNFLDAAESFIAAMEAYLEDAAWKKLVGKLDLHFHAFSRAHFTQGYHFRSLAILAETEEDPATASKRYNWAQSCFKKAKYLDPHNPIYEQLIDQMNKDSDRVRMNVMKYLTIDLASYFYGLGNRWHMKKDFGKAHWFFERSVSLFEKATMKATGKKMASMISRFHIANTRKFESLGDLYYYTENNFETALECYRMGESCIKEAFDTSPSAQTLKENIEVWNLYLQGKEFLCSSWINIANSLFEEALDNLNKAKDNFEKTLHTWKEFKQRTLKIMEIKEYELEGVRNYCLGRQMESQDENEADKYFSKAEEYFKKADIEKFFKNLVLEKPVSNEINQEKRNHLEPNAFE